MGTLHAQAMRRGGRIHLAGVVDLRDPGWGVPWSPSPERLAESTGARMAVVATPPATHRDLALECLRAGCDVLLEKPLCPDSSRAFELRDRFAAAGRVLFGGHTERFHPVFRQALAHRHRIGTVHRVEAVREGPRPLTGAPVGVALDLAVHDLDLVWRLVDGGLELVEASVDRDPRGMDAAVRAELRWPGGRARVRAGWSGERRRRIRIEGDAGVLELDFLAGTVILRNIGGEACPIPVPVRDPLEAEHEAFVAACRGGAGDSTDLEPQLQAVRLVESILSF